MATTVKLERGGKSAIGIVGFSWTTFFFGPWVPCFRGDLKWFVVMCILCILTWGFSNFIFGFIYNKIYTNSLLDKGFVPANDDSRKILAQYGLYNQRYKIGEINQSGITKSSVSEKTKNIASNIIDKTTKIVSEGTIRTVDNSYYANAEQEVDNNNVDAGLWSKALVNAKGDEVVRRSEYIKLRAKELQQQQKIGDVQQQEITEVEDQTKENIKTELSITSSNIISKQIEIYLLLTKLTNYRHDKDLLNSLDITYNRFYPVPTVQAEDQKECLSIINRLATLTNRHTSELSDLFADNFSYIDNAIGKYKHNLKDSVFKEYYKNGKLKKEIPLNKSCKIEGLVIEYYESGKIKSEVPCEDGKIEGITKAYAENGGLSKEISYKNGLKNGVEKVYRKNGKIFATITYDDDSIVSGIRHHVDGTTSPLTNAELTNWENGFDIESD